MLDISQLSFNGTIPDLDERNEQELLSQLLEDVNTSLQNAGFTDLTPVSVNSPLYTTLQAHTWLTAVLVAKINQLPLATLLALLNASDTEIDVGVTAKGTISIEVNQVPVTLPQGSLLVGSNGRNYKFTNEPVALTTLVTTGINIEAVQPGEVYNVAQSDVSFTITNQPGFIDTITVTSDLSGGRDPISEAEQIETAMSVLTRRDVLISADDYSIKAQELVNRAEAVATAPGNITLYAANEVGESLNSAEVLALESLINPLQALGAADIVVSSFDWITIDVTIIAEVVTAVNLDDLYDRIRVRLVDYYGLTNTVAGKPIRRNELIRVLSVEFPELSFVEAVLLNGNDYDVTVNFPYSLPQFNLFKASWVQNSLPFERFE